MIWFVSKFGNITRLSKFFNFWPPNCCIYSMWKEKSGTLPQRFEVQFCNNITLSINFFSPRILHQERGNELNFFRNEDCLLKHAGTKDFKAISNECFEIRIAADSRPPNQNVCVQKSEWSFGQCSRWELSNEVTLAFQLLQKSKLQPCKNFGQFSYFLKNA